MPRKGQHLSDEAKAKLRLIHLGKPAWNKGLPMTEKQKHKLSEARKKIKGWHHSEETKAKLRTTMNSPAVKEKIASKLRGENNPFYGHHHTPQSIEKGNRGRIAWLNDPENRRKTLEGSLKGWLALTHQLQQYRKEGLPNPCERLLFEIIESTCPGQYKYNNGWFFLAGKLPDFVNVNGQKKIIELFGELYHDKEEATERTNIFASVGWHTLIIWASELKDRKSVENRIKEFAIA